MKYLVSVVIPTYNRRKELCECIDSVLNQEYKLIEIIIVDDCSQDDTVEFIASHYKDVIIIESNHHYGPAYLRNRGLNKAKGTFILFLDSDVTLGDNKIINRMVKKLSQDRHIGQIGGEIQVYRGIKDVAYGKKIDFFGGNYKIVSRKSVPDYSRRKRCDYLATCNCMVRKEVAELVGGFDPYYVFGGEDVDFGYVIQKKGYINWVDYDVSVQHWHVSSGRYVDQSYRYASTRIRFNMKHFPIMKLFIVLLRDIVHVLIFYIILPPKIIIMAIRKKHFRLGHFLGGYYLFKAYIVSITSFFKIRKTKDLNFLSKEKMDEYEAYASRNNV